MAGHKCIANAVVQRSIIAFSPRRGENRGFAPSSRRQLMPTGHLYLNGFETLVNQKEDHPLGGLLFGGRELGKSEHKDDPIS